MKPPFSRIPSLLGNISLYFLSLSDDFKASNPDIPWLERFYKDPHAMVNPQDQLKQELGALFRYLQRVRQEIAAIDRPADQDHGFENMGDQMDAIVQATEAATNTIIEAMESTDETNRKLREGITDPDQVMLLDQINTNVNKVFEACAFQDITGQRVNRVVRSITYVEERVNALIALFGEEQISEVEVVVPPGQKKSADEALVTGPHAEGIGLSQDDIDKLFD